MSLISTGVQKLNDLLGGGVEEGSTVLYSGVPGIDARVFAFHALQATLSRGGKGLYFTDSQLPDAVRQAVKRMNWKYSLFEPMPFIDAFSGSVGYASKEKFFVKNPLDIGGVSGVVESAFRELDGNTLAVFDSVSSLIDKRGLEPVLKEVRRWGERGKSLGVTGLYLFTNWNYPEEVVSKIFGAFDYVVTLRSIEEKVLLRNYFSVVKAPGPFSKSAIPFRVGMDGVAVYIPKILVTGPFHSGKSSFIHAVSERAVSVDRLGTTIALDHGYLEHGGLAVDLFGTPGQERFEFMMDILNRDAFGLILLVDSTDPASFPRAKEMAAHIMRYAIPYAVAANKQDLPGALSTEEIRKLMGLGPEVPVLPTVAPSGKGCRAVLEALIDLIIRGQAGG
ncbi:MAG: ATPase domain-containing protein [Candidatus Micrarchaeia archaeon]